jgi:hypothetical protein
MILPGGTSPICDPLKMRFNSALNALRFPLFGRQNFSAKEKDMNRIAVTLIGAALLAGATGLVIAKTQQATGPIFIAGDRPVTEEQVRAKLQSDGWSNIVISNEGTYFKVTASRNGRTDKILIDSQTGRLGVNDDDDDDD